VTKPEELSEVSAEQSSETHFTFANREDRVLKRLSLARDLWKGRLIPRARECLLRNGWLDLTRGLSVSIFATLGYQFRAW